jgi:PST family polysaccharide transporter
MKNLFKATLITGSAAVINLLANLVRAKLTAIYLGPEGVAALAQVSAFVTLAVTVSSFGLASAIVRFVAEYKSQNRHHELRSLMLNATAFSAISSILITTAFLVFAPEVATFIYSKPIFIGLVSLSLLNIPIAVITNMGVGILQGFKEIRADAGLGIFSSITALIIITVLLIPMGLSGAVIGGLIANYVTSAVFFYFLIGIIKRHTDIQMNNRILSLARTRFSVRPLRPLAGLAAAGIMGGGATGIADILIRSKLISRFGLEVAGGIQPLISISSQYTGVIASAVGTYALPRLSEISGDRGRYNREINSYIRIMLLLVAPAAFILSIAAKIIIPILYTNKFLIAAPLIPIQSVSDVAKITFFCASTALISMSRGKIMVLLAFITPLSYYLVFSLLLPVSRYASIPIASGIVWLASSAIVFLVMRVKFGVVIDRSNLLLLSSSLVMLSMVATISGLSSGLPALLMSLIPIIVWGGVNIKKEEYNFALNIIKKKAI